MQGGSPSEPPRPARFSFEKLIVYQKAVEFLALTAPISQSTPRGSAWLLDQMRRAALSIPVNIAEATGRTTRADQRRHYSIARGSAMECAAVLDALRVIRAGDPRLLQDGRQLLIEIVNMLTKMCR